MIERIPDSDRVVKRVGDYLKSTTEEVSSLDLYEHCGCYRASAAIHRLRRRYGWGIKTRLAPATNRFGDKCGPVGWYSLKREAETPRV